MEGSGRGRRAGNGNSAGHPRVSAHDRLSFPTIARSVDANLTVLLTNDVDDVDLREKLHRRRLNGDHRSALAGRLGERDAAETSHLNKPEAENLKGELCSMCGVVCSSLPAHKLLESHRIEARQRREGIYRCNLCAKEYRREGDYSRHEQSEGHRERKTRKIQQWTENQKVLELQDTVQDLPARQKVQPLSSQRTASEFRKEAEDLIEGRKRKAEHGVNGDKEKRPREGQELYSAAAASTRTRVGRKPEDVPGQRRSLKDEMVAAQTRQQHEQERGDRIEGEGKRQTPPEPRGSGRLQRAKEEPVYTRIDLSANGDRESERPFGRLGREQREVAENGGHYTENGRGTTGGRPEILREDWLDLRLGLPEAVDLERSSIPDEEGQRMQSRWVLGDETVGGGMQEERRLGERGEAVAATSNGHAQQSRQVTSAGQERLANGTSAFENGGGAVRQRRAIELGGKVIKGEVPRGLFQASIDDEGFEVPEEVQAAVERGVDLPELAGPLNGKNYFDRMALLYHVEEAQMQLDILQFDQEVTLEKSGNPSYLMVFKVPGLAERKPCVAKGDKMILSRVETGRRHAGAPRYEVYAHDVRLESRAIYTQATFFDDKRKYTVRFTVRREPIVRALRSLELGRSANLEGFLYPTTIPDHDYIAPHFRARDTVLNPEQQQCVAMILYWTKQVFTTDARMFMIPPIIVFGPPGTGKTKTFAEAIFQVLDTYPESRILVCAPSNSAADNLLERIKFVEVEDAIRINSASRPAEGVGALPATLQKFARYNERTGFYTVPRFSEVSTMRVIVTTCSASYLLAKAGCPRGFFSHIFIDEAGHAVEPDCVVPLLNFATQGTIVALAGDHQQLGPVVRSPLAMRHGFGVSYLERLSSLPLYSPTDEKGRYVGYCSSIIRKLLRNYRSHPRILAVPSGVFYDGELDACADEESRESLCQWRELPTSGLPIIFHGLETPDDHEDDSPSWFNDGEIQQVRKYLEKLTASRRPRIQANEIGVIAPFRRQVQKLSTTLAKFPVTFGTVEDFQGQEMRVIILTTVRAEQGPAEEPRNIGADLRQGLGFLGNWKRFNVAVTRAKELLIIIGNPHVLKQDPVWAHMLHFCISKGAYQDRDCLPPSLEELEELSESLSDASACQSLAFCEPNENPAWPEPL